MKSYFRRTWLDIDTDALRENYEQICSKLASGARVMAVVKADAYGHGVEQIVKELTGCGCEWFAVSNLEEAMQVKDAAPDSSVLILGYTPPEYAERLAFNGISQAVFNPEYAKALSENAVKNGVQVRIHIKVDTGMSRLGFTYHDSVADCETASEVAQASRLEGLYPEGIFTHFACADEENGEAFTRVQYDLFIGLVHEVEKLGVKFETRHCCNSAATVIYPEMQLDMVRPGIILYGLAPSEFIGQSIKLRPVMKMKTVVSMVKEIPEGTPISYGRTFTSEHNMKIATVPVGYADGLPRALSGKAKMLVNGKEVPVVGRICMDQCMLDVTGIDGIKEGMTVTVFGSENNTVDNIASNAGVINYEIICGINKRVPRVYLEDGGVVAISDYLESK
ncbi:MAG: alanine racemase [Clostridia bacterium]|nr:alanine racemase [Clostridia bacterium]